MSSNAKISIVSLFIGLMACMIFSCSPHKVYPRLGKEVIVLKGNPGTWDENEVHTLSVVVANRSDYKYWGYYGLAYYDDSAEQGKAGLAWSNDLIHWVKYPGNPIIKSNCRWPSLVFVNGIFHMFYAQYDSNVESCIVRVSSKDGIHFSQEQLVVPLEAGFQNQNPFIYLNPTDQCYYLFYYHGKEHGTGEKIWSIYVKVAKDVTQLDQSPPIELLSSPYTIAAPSIAYYNGRYYLAVEALIPGQWDDKWIEKTYESSSLTAGFKEMENSPILTDDDACGFQYVFDGKLYLFYSHCYDHENNFWDLRMVSDRND